MGKRLLPSRFFQEVLGSWQDTLVQSSVVIFLELDLFCASFRHSKGTFSRFREQIMPGRVAVVVATKGVAVAGVLVVTKQLCSSCTNYSEVKTHLGRALFEHRVLVKWS